MLRLSNIDTIKVAKPQNIGTVLETQGIDGCLKKNSALQYNKNLK
jgi:hypothetical protein